MNLHFVKNWHYWKTFFTFPFEREIVFLGRRVFDNENELFEFLTKSEAGAFMWRDHEDFAALSNIYQIKIKIVTVAVVTLQEPDPDFKIVGAEFPSEKLPEMIIFHVKATHYDLIVPNKSKIAEEGGLDYQRTTKSNTQKINQIEEEKIEESDKEKILVQTKIAKLEEELKNMEEKVGELEAEKQELSKQAKLNTEFKCY